MLAIARVVNIAAELLPLGVVGKRILHAADRADHHDTSVDLVYPGWEGVTRAHSREPLAMLGERLVAARLLGFAYRDTTTDVTRPIRSLRVMAPLYRRPSRQPRSPPLQQSSSRRLASSSGLVRLLVFAWNHPKDSAARSRARLASAPATGGPLLPRECLASPPGDSQTNDPASTRLIFRTLANAFLGLGCVVP
jgi:hypothetical protein